MAAGRGSRRRRIAFRGRLGARVAIAPIAVPLLLVKALAETAVTAPTWCSAVDPHRPQAGTSVSFVMVVMFWTLLPASDKPVTQFAGCSSIPSGITTPSGGLMLAVEPSAGG